MRTKWTLPALVGSLGPDEQAGDLQNYLTRSTVQVNYESVWICSGTASAASQVGR